MSGGDEGYSWPAFQDREGNRIVSTVWTTGSKIQFSAATGEQWIFGAPYFEFPESYALRAIFDGHRHVIVSANLQGEARLNGQLYGREGERTNLLFTLGYSGELLSIHQAEVAGDILDAAPGGYYLHDGRSLHRVSTEGKLLETRALPELRFNGYGLIYCPRRASFPLSPPSRASCWRTAPSKSSGS